MGNFFRYYMLLARRWMWLCIVCVIICGSATYLISSFLRPVYQASAYLIIDVGASTHPSISDSLQAVPTFAQLVTIPTVLNPVVAQHPGMSVQDLSAMLVVKPQTNTQIIELDVQASTPQLASDLANQVAQSFARYANSNTPGTIQIIPASPPSLPAQPRPLQSAGIGASVGLVLALSLVMLFEWIGNRPTSVEQIQKLVDTEILALLPRSTRKTRRFLSEKYQALCAGLDIARASNPFKLVMFTSAFAGEGKSVVASNVAIHLAQAGKKVLLVDLNLHRPALAREFQLSDGAGLTNVLARNGNPLLIERYAQPTALPGLSVLLVGTQQMSSAELVRALTVSQLFTQLKQSTFDYILFDASPLLGMPDTQVLSALVEALVLIVDGTHTPCKALREVRQLLKRMQGTRILGVVVNQSPWRDFAELQPYAPLQEISVPRVAQASIEGVTQSLPALEKQPLITPLPVSELGTQRLSVDTGESERLSQATSERVIRPGISLSGLTIAGNGLIKRSFPAGAVPSTPDTFPRF